MAGSQATKVVCARAGSPLTHTAAPQRGDGWSSKVPLLIGALPYHAGGAKEGFGELVSSWSLGRLMRSDSSLRQL